MQASGKSTNDVNEFARRSKLTRVNARSQWKAQKVLMACLKSAAHDRSFKTTRLNGRAPYRRACF